MIVALVLVSTAIEAVLNTVGTASALDPLLVVFLGLVGAAAVLYRKQWPVASLLTVTAIGVATQLLSSERQLSFGFGIATVAVVYALCRWSPPRVAALGMLVVLGVRLAAAPQSDLPLLDETVNILVSWFLVAALALAMRFRSGLRHQQLAQVRLQERQDLARELHDVVAHHVSAIAVQAQAAQAVSETNPAATSEILHAIETTASTTLTEMRRMVGILRAEGSDRAPIAEGASLRSLADATGEPAVRLSGAGVLDDSVPVSIAAASYRIVQEAITNARRHGLAREPIEVTVSRADGAINLVVTNPANTGALIGQAGFGLIGMTERAEALGGSLVAGPVSGDRWQVRAKLPLA